jgi:hypothetical protein
MASQSPNRTPQGTTMNVGRMGAWVKESCEIYKQKEKKRKN